MFQKLRYRRKVSSLLRAAEKLARSLDRNAPTERSRRHFSAISRSLHLAQSEIRSKLDAGATREDLLYDTQNLKELLHNIAVAHSKGEIPIARPDLLREALELETVFQESEFLGEEYRK